MRSYDKIFVIWDKKDRCIARLPLRYAAKKTHGIYLCRSHITSSPKAVELLKDPRYIIREVLLDGEI